MAILIGYRLLSVGDDKRVRRWWKYDLRQPWSAAILGVPFTDVMLSVMIDDIVKNEEHRQFMDVAHRDDEAGRNVIHNYTRRELFGWLNNEVARITTVRYAHQFEIRLAVAMGWPMKRRRQVRIHRKT